jgi:putative transposase
MKKSKFTEEQIALRLADGGTPQADACRQLGVSELRTLRSLEDENARPRRRPHATYALPPRAISAAPRGVGRAWERDQGRCGSASASSRTRDHALAFFGSGCGWDERDGW